MADWKDRGQTFIECLARWGHQPWSADPDNERTCLGATLQEKFTAAISEFAAASENFPKGLHLPVGSQLKAPTMHVSGDEKLILDPIDGIRAKISGDFTLREIETEAAAREYRLLLLGIERHISSERIANLVKSRWKEESQNDVEREELRLSW